MTNLHRRPTGAVFQMFRGLAVTDRQTGLGPVDKPVLTRERPMSAWAVRQRHSRGVSS